MTSNDVSKQSNEIVKFITKKDLMRLRKYEEQNRYMFNRAVSDEFLDDLKHWERLPLGWTMIHNGVEIRSHVAFKDGHVLVDMPFSMYFGLERYDLNARCVKKAKYIKFELPNIKLRKGINVYRLIDRTTLESLIKSSVIAPTTCGDLTVDQFLNAIPKDGHVEIREAFFQGDNDLWFTACLPEYRYTTTISAIIPVAMFFGLETKIVDWDSLIKAVA